MANTFSVGWHRIDITPKTPTPLDGMGNDYGRQANWIPAEQEEDRLKANIMVLADGVSWDNTLVLCTMDTLFIHEAFSKPAAAKIAHALQIPAGNVFFCASHTHSGVSMDEPDASVVEYIDWLYTALPEAAQKAVEDMAPTEAKIGALETTGMNAQRRYRLKDGSHRSTVGDKTYGSDDILGYETQPDHELRAIRFMRQGKKDIMLINWQAHPSFTGSTALGRVSADMAGSVRTYFEQSDPDCCFAFIQGAAGNMGRAMRWEQDPWYAKTKSFDRESYCKEFVRLLQQEMVFRNAQLGQIVIKHKGLTVHRKKFNQILDETWSLPLSTVSFGDIAICTIPGELFSDGGLELRRRSAYAMTFVSACTNGNFGYLPMEACFAGDPEFKSFEVRVSKCQPGTAEKIVEELSAML